MACGCKKRQKHVHEVLGSVKIYDEKGECHNHRFAGMTGEAVSVRNGKSHIHYLDTTTDFYEDHYHDICVRLGEAIDVGGGRHVHYVYAKTEISDGHRHEFQVATLIEDPIGEIEEDK